MRVSSLFEVPIVGEAVFLLFNEQNIVLYMYVQLNSYVKGMIYIYNNNTCFCVSS